MKKLFILLILFSAFSCKHPKSLDQAFGVSSATNVIIRLDSVKLKQETAKQQRTYDSLLKRVNKGIDSLKRENDSLRIKLFLANYKVEKVRFYIKICMNKPSQDKFLKGWVRRAIE
jgi:hypothetical protein